MKKILVLISILLAFTLCACNNSTPNPIVEYETLDEINKIIGTNLVDIKEYGKVSDEHFSVIDNKIAEYSFVIDGYDLCFRGSKTLDEDISGLYINSEPAFTDLSGRMSFGGDEENKAFRFVENDNCQYTLTSKYQEDPNDDLFLKYIDLISKKIIKTVSKPEIVELAGDYEDTVSELSYATVFLYGINEPWLQIDYIFSQNETESWTMKLKDEGNGKYSYEEFSHYHYYFLDGQTNFSDYEEIKDSTPGSIEYKDGKIIMLDSNIDLLKELVLEKEK